MLEQQKVFWSVIFGAFPVVLAIGGEGEGSVYWIAAVVLPAPVPLRTGLHSTVLQCTVCVCVRVTMNAWVLLFS